MEEPDLMIPWSMGGLKPKWHLLLGELGWTQRRPGFRHSQQLQILSPSTGWQIIQDWSSQVFTVKKCHGLWALDKCGQMRPDPGAEDVSSPGPALSYSMSMSKVCCSALCRFSQILVRKIRSLWLASHVTVGLKICRRQWNIWKAC